MPKWCVESYPSSLYKFEKTRFWHFVIISGRGQGGPNPCLLSLCNKVVVDFAFTDRPHAHAQMHNHSARHILFMYIMTCTGIDQ